MSTLQIQMPFSQTHPAPFWTKGMAKHRVQSTIWTYNAIDTEPLDHIENNCRPEWEFKAKSEDHAARYEADALENYVKFQFRQIARAAVNGLSSKLHWAPESKWQPPIEWDLLALIVTPKVACRNEYNILKDTACDFAFYLFNREQARAAIIRIDNRLREEKGTIFND